MTWLPQSYSNVNNNISLAQFSFTVDLADSYNTDYYDIAYPGIIMKVMVTKLCLVHDTQYLFVDTFDQTYWVPCGPDIYSFYCVCGEHVFYNIIFILIFITRFLLGCLYLYP